MKRFLVLSALWLASFNVSLSDAQMKTGPQMLGYDDTFGVRSDDRTPAFAATLLHDSVPGNILFPDDRPTFVFRLTNRLNRPLKADAKIDLIPFGTRGVPGDVWQPIVFKNGNVTSHALPVDLAAGASGDFTITPDVPPTFGGYALVADLGENGRQVVTTFVRTFAASTATLQYPKFSLDELSHDVLERLGVQAVRVGVDWTLPDALTHDKVAADLDEHLNQLKSKKITAMLMVMASSIPQPLGRPRPWLTDDNVMLQTKSDMAWLPQYDGDFRTWVKQTCIKYGWPNGPVTAFSLWNEPWEGMSISGWGADLPRYREMYTAMAQGIEDARKEAGVQVLIGGCDSSANAVDKLFSDGTDKMLPRFDFVSIHYQGLESPATFKQWRNRTGPNGRVKIWDTESWVANTDDRVAAVVAANRAVGYDRSMGIFGGNIADKEKNVTYKSPDGAEAHGTAVNTWPVAAAIGAMQHFVGERDFGGMLFPNGLPWVMCFNGLNNNHDDGALVVVGDLGEAFGADGVLFRTVRGLNETADLEAMRQRLADLPKGPASNIDRLVLQAALKNPVRHGTMTIAAGDHYGLFDFYGNPVAPAEGKIVVPLDHRGFFLRPDGSAGSYDALCTAVRAGRIDGIEPAEVIPLDFTAPLDTRPPLRVRLTNVLNRPINGTLSATGEGLSFDNAPVALQPGEMKVIELPLKSSAARLDNTYPVQLRFDAGAEGVINHAESLHANLIAHRTITVDGNLDDWKGVAPQPVAGKGTEQRSLTEAAWFPFAKFDPSMKAGFANGYLAYDNQFFYFAAKVADDTPDAGAMRIADRDDDQFYYPETSYAIDNNKSLIGQEFNLGRADDDRSALQLPDGNGRVKAFWGHTPANTTVGIDLTLPTDAPKRVALYFGPWDVQDGQGVWITVTDRTTGKELAKEQHIDRMWKGVYVIYELTGDVRIRVRSREWYTQKFCGLFFDPTAKETKHAKMGASATFVGTDFDTLGDWKGHYGTDGYQLVGVAPHLPAYAKLALANDVVKQTYTWPAGVRRFSYRKGPFLPAGDAPRIDNVQIAFNVLPEDQKPSLMSMPGVPAHFGGYPCTDYEYALNQVAPAYGGGYEVWRMLAPGMPVKEFYPRQPKSPLDGPVAGAKLIVRRDGNTRIVEAALPWSEIPKVRAALDAGKTIKFSYRVNDNAGDSMELDTGRSVSKRNAAAFHSSWKPHWANELEFAFER